MNRYVGMLMLILSVMMSACASGAAAPSGGDAGTIGAAVAVPGGAYTDVSVAELKTMLASKNFTLVNTHVPFEGNIAATDRSIPFDQIGQRLNELPADKNAKIVLYCRTGRMSEIAARALVQQGYANVWNLQGGMVAWEQAGLKLEGR